jgi:ribosome recycling factor
LRSGSASARSSRHRRPERPHDRRPHQGRDDPDGQVRGGHAQRAEHDPDRPRLAALLDRVTVDYYGQQTPLNQLATLNVPEPRLLTVQPFDPSSLGSIERAIQESDLGLNPSNDGKIIRLPIPQLTEERRKELVKVARQIAEDGRVAVRNVRRDVIHHLKEEQSVGADEEHRAEERVQKLTDEHVTRIDELLKRKEAEITEV